MRPTFLAKPLSVRVGVFGRSSGSYGSLAVSRALVVHYIRKGSCCGPYDVVFCPIFRFCLIFILFGLLQSSALVGRKEATTSKRRTGGAKNASAHFYECVVSYSYNYLVLYFVSTYLFDPGLRSQQCRGSNIAQRTPCRQKWAFHHLPSNTLCWPRGNSDACARSQRRGRAASRCSRARATPRAQQIGMRAWCYRPRKRAARSVAAAFEHQNQTIIIDRVRRSGKSCYKWTTDWTPINLRPRRSSFGRSLRGPQPLDAALLWLPTRATSIDFVLVRIRNMGH